MNEEEWYSFDEQFAPNILPKKDGSENVVGKTIVDCNFLTFLKSRNTHVVDFLCRKTKKKNESGMKI